MDGVPSWCMLYSSVSMQLVSFPEKTLIKITLCSRQTVWCSVSVTGAQWRSNDSQKQKFNGDDAGLNWTWRKGKNRNMEQRELFWWRIVGNRCRSRNSKYGGNVPVWLEESARRTLRWDVCTGAFFQFLYSVYLVLIYFYKLQVHNT